MFRKPILCLLLAALCVAGSLGMATATEVDCDCVYCFDQKDFSGKEEDIEGICITGLPDPAVGTVMLGTRVLRTGDILTAAQVDEMTFGNTALDLSTGMLVCGDKSLRLSAKEFDVMRFLLQSRGQNLSKEVILARVWGYDSNAVENHVEVYVGFLRKKLSAIGSNLRIAAIRRLGYHLEVEELAEEAKA
jgi:DNA-binding winged helix-turn-helix (wHTH) protein